MHNEISIVLLGYLLATSVALFTVHVLLSRYGGWLWRMLPPQVLLVRLVLTFNLVMLAGAWLIARHEARDAAQTMYMLVFAFLVFNGIAYAYFHFFNMSETARRIRMLLQIRRAGPAGLRVQELERQYSPKDMISARLDRLARMNQLLLTPDGRYRVAGNTLLWAGRIMGLWRRLVLRRVLRDIQ
ncbi:MAG: hypothetical protein ACYC1T_08185 [Sulfuricaulis sp.]